MSGLSRTSGMLRTAGSRESRVRTRVPRLLLGLEGPTHRRPSVSPDEGGEKSYSTICFILAIWEAMETPFRCLDEFDIFMVGVCSGEERLQTGGSSPAILSISVNRTL